MATRRKRKAKEIDVNKPLKKNELSLDFMMAYIEEKVADEDFEKAKEEFKKESRDADGKYTPKKARDFFAEKYPDAIKKPEKKSAKSADDKLNDW